MLTLDEVNALSDAGFADRFADVAEHSAWVAERAAAARPFATRGAMIAAFQTAAANASQAEILALIRAHPDLAGRARLTPDSAKEQAGAGLDTLTETEFARFTDLNGRYRERFGFPFIFAVKGADKHQILASFEARIDHDMDTELATALTMVQRIIAFRLEDRVVSEPESRETDA
jgi:2-oxo-4-hydroxy-4-carboxy-5-ureidoimidazoline decarboxylase